MLDFLKKTFHRLIRETQTDFYRSLYSQINLDNRLTGIVGPRGVGKTTLMLQTIKDNFLDHDDVFYFSADNFYFEDIA